MTINYRETSFGRPLGEPQKVWPGTRHWLRFDGGLNLWHIPAGSFLRVRTSDSIEVTSFIGGFGLDTPKIIEKDAINKEKLQTSPLLSFDDLIHWRRRHFFWEEDK
jgi:hypothetical protein